MIQNPNCRFWALLLVVIGALFLAGCFPSHLQSTFDAKGPVAEKRLTLFQIIFWAAAFVFVVVEGALIFVVLRFRRKPGETQMPPQTHGHQRLEVAWTIAPAVVLAVLTFSTTPLYAGYVGAPRLWEMMTPLMDQQVGGLLMKTGGGLGFLTVAVVVFVLWFNRDQQAAEPVYEERQAPY